MDTQTALEALDPRMRDTLAALSRVNRNLVEVIIQLVPFAERPSLINLGIIRNGKPISAEYHSAEITDFGWTVIDAAGE